MNFPCFLGIPWHFSGTAGLEPIKEVFRACWELLLLSRTPLGLLGTPGPFRAFLCPFQEFPLASHKFQGERGFGFPGMRRFPPLSVAPRHKPPLGGRRRAAVGCSASSDIVQSLRVQKFPINRTKAPLGDGRMELQVGSGGRSIIQHRAPSFGCAPAASPPNLLWAFIQALGKDVIKTALGEADPFKQPSHLK